jgi:hypothetical protein
VSQRQGAGEEVPGSIPGGVSLRRAPGQVLPSSPALGTALPTSLPDHPSRRHARNQAINEHVDGVHGPLSAPRSELVHRVSIVNAEKVIQRFGASALNGRRRSRLVTLATMGTKRQQYDPLKTSAAPRWLVRVDNFGNVIEARELAPGADLRAALAEGIEVLRRDGWSIEGVSFGSTFVHRGEERHQLGVYPTDPYDQPRSTHGPYPITR